MQALLLVASFLFLAAVLVYMHAMLNFYALVKVERPDWVDRRGSLGFFYTGMPSLANPNVGLAAIGIAFSTKRHELRFSQARKYADRIRILLPLGLALFLSILAIVIVRSP